MASEKKTQTPKKKRKFSLIFFQFPPIKFLANNLYGSCETFKLPVGNFEWVSKKQLESWTAEDILNIETQGEIGYAFEVDMIYPKKYHEVVMKEGKKHDIHF